MTPLTPRSNSQVYFDHNATSPIDDRVKSHVLDWLEQWGNPSSIHQAGRGPKALMRVARDQISQALGVNPLELIFTSGGSESNNLALKGVFEHFDLSTSISNGAIKRKQYLISSVEHPSLRRTAEYLKARGAQIDILPVRRDGSIDLVAYRNLLSDQTALVSVMLANNETGNLFPIREMAQLAHQHGALFHSDCVQALGKMPLNLRELGVDLASFSGHKFYSLKGCGVLYARKGVGLESQIHGGGQERHRRGGTENILAIASLGSMCALKHEVPERAERMRILRDHLEARVGAEISQVNFTGIESLRIPNTSSMVIDGVDGETMLMNLDMRGFAVSTGAACSSGSPEPSPVLLAMGLTRSEAQSSLRVGIGWSTTLEQVDQFVETLKSVVSHIRSFSGLSIDDRKAKGDQHVNP